MGDTFRQAIGSLLSDSNNASPDVVLVRLLASLVFGVVVAWIYSRTQGNGESGATLPTTLVLLAVLIAMVTQVIGDNVARAFSLVGALSIVRFRTVVRDTRDTAFVIFAVAVGMAAGAQNFWLACLGLLVGGGAAFVMSRMSGSATAVPSENLDQLLRVRSALGVDLTNALEPALKEFAAAYNLVSIGSVKQGTAMEAAIELKTRAGKSAEQFVREVNRIEGVQEVRLVRKGLEEG